MHIKMGFSCLHSLYLCSTTYNFHILPPIENIYIYISTTDGFFEIAIESWPEWNLSPRSYTYIIYSIQNIHIQKSENCAGIELDRSKKNLSF